MPSCVEDELPGTHSLETPLLGRESEDGETSNDLRRTGGIFTLPKGQRTMIVRTRALIYTPLHAQAGERADATWK